MNTAIFIMSCDNTRDVLKHFIHGINKYWKDNRLPIFLGNNSNIMPENLNNTILLSSPKSTWKQETLNQLHQIKINNPNITHLLVLLDDFILNKSVDNNSLLNIIYQVEIQNLNYLRLKRLEDSFIMKLLQYFISIDFINKIKIFKIRNTHPYYSSLQVAIWDIDYLINLLNSISNIWEFELQNKLPNSHFSVLDNVFSYKHVVEKGRWETYAKKYCLKHIEYFNRGERGVHEISFLTKVIKLIKSVKFFLFGYSFSRKFNL